MKKIAIIGCGWLGLPLALHLRSLQYTIIGTSRNAQTRQTLTAAHITALDFTLTESSTLPSSLTNVDCAVINIPPRRKVQDIEKYASIIQNTVRQFNGSAVQLIFISSTSVYPSAHSHCTEEDADPKHELFMVEELVRQHVPNSTILRCAGLAGPDRYIVHALAQHGRAISHALPVNLVHRHDVIKAITTVIEHPNDGGTYNICADLHPPKGECYKKWAQIHATPLVFIKDQVKGKVIDNAAFKAKFNFHYDFPDPMDFFDN